jgi:hypothetical protein
MNTNIPGTSPAASTMFQMMVTKLQKTLCTGYKALKTNSRNDHQVASHWVRFQ